MDTTVYLISNNGKPVEVVQSCDPEAVEIYKQGLEWEHALLLPSHGRRIADVWEITIIPFKVVKAFKAPSPSFSLLREAVYLKARKMIFAGETEKVNRCLERFHCTNLSEVPESQLEALEKLLNNPNL